MVNKFYRINQNIRAAQVRVIGEDGKQIGILNTFEAQKLAREKDLDLVEIAPMAKPPVAKIINFKKFLYQEEKRERESKKKIKGGEIKGVRLTPFMAKADLEVRIRRAEEFLKEGNKVRLDVRFMGRQLGKREFGYAVLKRTIEILAHCSRPEGEPKWFGRSLVLTLTPTREKHGEKDEKIEKEAKNEKISPTTIQADQEG